MPTPSSPRIPCDYGCVNGLVPHPRRMLFGDTPDIYDKQTEETCPKCLGAGTVPYEAPKVVKEHVDEKGG